MKRILSWGVVLLPILLTACGDDSGSATSMDESVGPDDSVDDAGHGREFTDEETTDAEEEDVEETSEDFTDADDAEETDSAESRASAEPDSTGEIEDARGAEPEQSELEEDNRQFEDVGVNPFVFVDHDPLSTFAADVDTASYDIFRKDVSGGRLPPPASVRLEEYVNYFDYDYPEPEDEETPFRVALAAAPNLLDNGTTLLRVGIQGKTLADDQRKPMNLVFLVDTSGSMQSEDKLPLVQRLLIDSLDLMAPEDTIAIVTYAGSSGVALPATPASQAAEIKRTINGFSAGGSTAGAQGIEAAYGQAADNFLEGGVNHVILCTDGDFNVGISNTEDLVEFIEDKRRTGITFTALGFGSGNLNDETMEAITNAGNGTYAVIGDQQHAHDYVTDRLFSGLQFIAKDMKIQVEFNPEHVLAYRLLGYENRAIADQDFRNDVVDAGEIGSGHRVTALYELVMMDGTLPMPEGAEPPEDGESYDGPVEVAEADIALVKVRYKDVDATALDEAYEVGFGLPQVDVADSHRDLDEDFQWAVAIASFAEVLKGSPYVDESVMPQVEWVVEAQQDRDDDRAQFVDLFHDARELMGVPEAGEPPLVVEEEPDGGVASEPDGGSEVEEPTTGNDGGVQAEPEADAGAGNDAG